MKYRLNLKRFMEVSSTYDNDEINFKEIQCYDKSIPTILLDEDGYLAMLNTKRKPAYAVRGKPVSKDTALEIIRKTDNYLKNVSRYKWEADNPIGKLFVERGVYPKKYSCHSVFANNWFPRPEELACGWCHPDGYIGTTDYSKIKYPFPSEMLDMWYFLMSEVTSKLDLIVIVYDVNEIFKPKCSITSQIAFGLLVTGLQVEVLNKRKAAQAFSEYDSKYGDHNLVRPLRVPEVLGIETFDPYQYTFTDLDRGGWCENISYCNHFLDLSGIEGEGTLIPAIDGKVDKNNVMYYGVPDFTYQEGPLTIKDLEGFIEKWKSESDDEEG